MRIIDDAAIGPYERVVHAIDEACGLNAIVAIHSTVLGPAVGGTRFLPYPSPASAAIDVLRLAEGMTLKAAAAGLDVGGGKAVIVVDPAQLRCPALWRAYAEVVDVLGGAYHAAEDVGTTVADMAALRAHTPHVLGLADPDAGHDGDPSPFTARGVLAAMRAAWVEETGTRSLEGVRVVVQGVGKVVVPWRACSPPRAPTSGCATSTRRARTPSPARSGRGRCPPPRRSDTRATCWRPARSAPC
jgi:glutamate dehydrogenase/leucine dehydrogenase